MVSQKLRSTESILKSSDAQYVYRSTVSMMSTKFLLNKIPELKASHVIIKNPEVVEKKIQALIDGGLKRLQIVSDFDRTLTRQRNEDDTTPLTSFGLLHLCPSFPESSKIEAVKLYKKYRPCELDETLSRKEKCDIMLKWWTEEENLLRGFRLPPEEFEETAKHSHTHLRDGALEMLKLMNSYNVPVLIFSAGIGNSIEAVLKVNNINFPNVKIVSNFLKFKDGDILDGMTRPMIHILNKNEQAIHETEYFDLVRDRDNVILMGDAIGDSEMSEGVPHNTVLKIGFVYEEADQVLSIFCDSFDIVLVDDQTMNIPSTILELISKNI